MDTKRLELFLLAGCSCLLTLLAQPIASAIASPPELPNLAKPLPTNGAHCAVKFSDPDEQRPSIS